MLGLNDLAKAVRYAMAALIPLEQSRSFVGHLTLGRMRGASVCELVDGSPAEEWTIDEVVLVQSTLGSGGAVHRPVARLPLRPSRRP
ncbi:MAG: hypothetical protein R2715_19130 [Ilumatobacteraceae bacterium]